MLLLSSFLEFTFVYFQITTPKFGGVVYLTVQNLIVWSIEHGGPDQFLGLCLKKLSATTPNLSEYSLLKPSSHAVVKLKQLLRETNWERIQVPRPIVLTELPANSQQQLITHMNEPTPKWFLCPSCSHMEQRCTLLAGLSTNCTLVSEKFDNCSFKP